MSVAEPSFASDFEMDKRTARVGELAIFLGALLAALAMQLFWSINSDVSWFLTLNERMLAGDAPYIDIIEVNPPASILLYTAPAFIGKWLGFRPEMALSAGLAALIVGILAWVSAIIREHSLMQRGHATCLLVMIAVVASVLPIAEFAQREHFALLFILPYGFLSIARARGQRISLPQAVLAGVLLGLCIAIKPYFALCAVNLSVFLYLKTRRLMVFASVENLCAGLVAGAYVVLCVIAFPRFFSDMMPLLADLYLPARNDIGVLLERMGLGILPPLIICMLCRGERYAEGVVVMLLIAAGFLAAYFIQGKGWDNHAYPVLGFCLIAAAFAVSSDLKRRSLFLRGVQLSLLGVAVALATPKFWKVDSGRPALKAAITAMKPHPTMLVLGLPISLGHPLVRDIGGSFVGSVASIWITPGAMMMKERAGNDAAMNIRADNWLELDRRLAAQDIERKNPDLVLVEIHPGFDFASWIAASPRLRLAMDRYELVETVDNVSIWRNRHLAQGRS